MKCVVCNGEDLNKRVVDEEIRSGPDVIIVPIQVVACASCGERYYSRENIQYLEKVRDSIPAEAKDLIEIGRVFKYEKDTAHVA
ncbi:MAG: YgiT-type zinc finger protein [Spirochaetales bacterium]|nr:YgiT-type zinc finger protein [Spirochaetales bacterium]